LIFVQFKDLHVGACIAEVFFRDLAERIAGLDRVSLCSWCRRRRSGGRLCRGRRRAGRCARSASHPNVSVDILLPGGNGLNRIPDFVLFCLSGDGSLEYQLAALFFDGAMKLSLGHFLRPRIHTLQRHGSPSLSRVIGHPSNHLATLLWCIADREHSRALTRRFSARLRVTSALSPLLREDRRAAGPLASGLTRRFQVPSNSAQSPND
jgi:hypothetical protein